VSLDHTAAGGVDTKVRSRKISLPAPLHPVVNNRQVATGDNLLRHFLRADHRLIV
jgi:hypothetical protein